MPDKTNNKDMEAMLSSKEKHKSRIIRLIFIISGFISTGLGTIGIFVPVLPTTPFLLLAAYLFARSSDRFHIWLLTNRLFGTYLRNYIEKKGIPLKVKIMTLILLWTTILYSVFAVIDNLYIRILLIIIAVSVSIHISMVKTLKNKGGK